MSACVCVCVYVFISSIQAPLFLLSSPLRKGVNLLYLPLCHGKHVHQGNYDNACDLTQSKMQVILLEHNNICLENLLPPFSSFVLHLSAVGFSVGDNEKCHRLELEVMEPYHQKHRGSLWLPAWTESWSGALAGQPYLPQAQLL